MTLSDSIDTSPNVNEQSQEVGDSFAPGQLVAGKYKVISLIGKGGMGSVYKVNQVLLDKEYALKTVNSITVTDTQIRRFHAEAKMTASLSHPNLVHVHDFGVLECGNPYLIMDFVEGTTLAEHLRLHGPLTTEKAALIMGQACLGLFYSHNNGVIHRDLKPGNIMLAHDFAEGLEGSVRIVDFGIAKIIRADEGQLQALTRTGEIFGSPLYMSPEQCSGSLVDHRSDIYSLGCVLLEALTGTPPHVGQNAMATMMSHLSDTAPTLKQASMGKEFEESFEKIVAKMLEKKPCDRYQNLGAVAYDLSKATAGGANQMRRAMSPGLVKVKKTREETLTLKKSDLYKVIGLLILTTAVISAFCTYLLLKHKWQSDTAIPSGSSVYSTEYALANKVVSERIQEGEQARSQVIDRVRHPVSGRLKLRELDIDANLLDEISKSKAIRTLD
ncbi:MAG: serine/threonine protein kinase, partial [Leptolyngbya sp.]|nr:serine/threonine protein kinase [Candidatus Melainabacteria bacterium]